MSEIEQQQEVKEDEFLDIDIAFRPVAKKYGREIFAAVYNSGMSRQAMEVLGQLVNKHQSRHGMHAVQVLANCYNAIASELCKTKGWDAGLLAQVDRDIQLAFRSQIQIAGADSPLILQH